MSPDEELRKAAFDAMENAYAPYSKFRGRRGASDRVRRDRDGMQRGERRLR